MSDFDFVVELEKGVWIAPWDGDPGRCLDMAGAKRFTRKIQAERALKKARKYKPFLNAEIYEG